MLPVVTKLSGGASVGDSAGVADGMTVGLAIADVPEVVAAGLLGVLPQPAKPMVATMPTSARHKPDDSEP
jgi:hypothetical protein